jgi:hypothetical protein
MKTRDNILWLMIEQVLPWLVLVILLTYSYAKVFRHSYGFRVEPSTGLVALVFEKQLEPTLRENDRIIQIGPIPWGAFGADLRKPFFEGYIPGDIVPITVERDGQEINISWEYPAFSVTNSWTSSTVNGGSRIFWLAGVLTILLIRRKIPAGC